MMKVILDGRLMISREAMHDLLAEQLEFRGYYGRNLDALYDLLTSYPDVLDISVTYASVLLNQLGNYGQALLDTLLDAARECPNVTVSILGEKN